MIRVDKISQHSETLTDDSICTFLLAENRLDRVLPSGISDLSSSHLLCCDVNRQWQADTEAAQAVSRRLRAVVRKSKTESSGRGFVSRFGSRNEISAPGLLVTA